VVFYGKACLRLWEYLTQLFLEREMFRKKVVEKLKTHILCSIKFFWKSCRLWYNVEEYSRARRASLSKPNQMNDDIFFSVAQQPNSGLGRVVWRFVDNIRGLLEKYPTFGREKETGLLGALDT
jgi:hypothetical protein